MVGGNAGSVTVAGQRADHGSHRLHPVCQPEILAELRELLGADLLDRPRHGRIRLRGRWIHFPLRPFDLLFHLPRDFAAGVARDTLRKTFQPSNTSRESFVSVLRSGLGPTICDEFYIPFARKIWGVDPSELSAAQAVRRVAANSPGKMLRKVMAAVPGLRPAGSGRFYYPRQGFGQITEALAEKAAAQGAAIRLNARVTAVRRKGRAVTGIEYEHEGQRHALDADHVWSTLPLGVMIRALTPPAPEGLISAAREITFRGMILVYLVLDQDRFTEYDAHYFPEESIPFTRLSEPKNYAARRDPEGQTVLCAEVPCDPNSATWRQDDEQLAQMVRDGLAAAGLPVSATVSSFEVRRLKNAYPIYLRGYEERFDAIDEWLNGFEGLLTFGRLGLFAHDNTHHALYMAKCAVECLDATGSFDWSRWQSFRGEFARHVVED